MRVTFGGGNRFQGYRNIIHGGILAMVLDSAMTHCLFARGIVGVTADLHIRYRHPVPADKEIIVTCTVTQRKLKLLTLNAELQQEGHVKVLCEARFWRLSEA
jgi:acyl-coenzyme A thioesterase PaaI-like protein